MGPNPTRECVDWVRCPCSTPFRDKISAAPPRCSPNTRLGKMPRECASGEQQGGAAEILSRNGVEHEQRTQSTHPRAVRGKRWTIRKSCGDKYAIECIFIDATLSDGRPRLRDLMWKFNLVTWLKERMRWWICSSPSDVDDVVDQRRDNRRPRAPTSMITPPEATPEIL